MRQVIIYPDEDSVFVAECPSLPGCRSQGDTIEEAFENIKDAIKLWIEDAIANGEQIPADYPIFVGAVAVEVPTP
ncbi:MAG: type II toxin-antitoxin system HicB family antitoxin [Anaerolineae bacterium]|nr:type II toxin-antitoxin system HicB family antitoxin [Anaerolineae bacterium]